MYNFRIVEITSKKSITSKIFEAVHLKLLILQNVWGYLKISISKVSKTSVAFDFSKSYCRLEIILTSNFPEISMSYLILYQLWGYAIFEIMQDLKLMWLKVIKISITKVHHVLKIFEIFASWIISSSFQPVDITSNILCQPQDFISTSKFYFNLKNSESFASQDSSITTHLRFCQHHCLNNKLDISSSHIKFHSTS